MSAITLEINTPDHQAMVPITDQINAALAQLGLRDGVVHCFTEHTTCGLMVNENADPDVVHDLLLRLETLAPWHDRRDRHAEGNSAAHLRSALIGCATSLPVTDGRLRLGTWQGVFLCEFDGPRRRRVRLTALGT